MGTAVLPSFGLRLPPHATLLWSPQPGPQEALLSCPVEDVLFGGARGGGKSDALLGDWMSHADLYGPDARGVFFRRTYPELEEIQRRAEELFTPLGARWWAVKRSWEWPSGAMLKLRYMERDADSSRYQGHQYTYLGIDELTQWPRPEPIDKLRACLRSAAGVPCYFRATANPGGPGHNWVKARYVDPAPPYVPHFDEKAQVRRVFIPARLEDNPALMLNDPEYWRRVEAAAGGNEALLRAWRHGSWDIVAGGVFDDLWFKSPPVLPAFPIPSSWSIDRSFDWGSSRPFSAQWWAETDGTTAPNGVTYPAGTLVLIQEWYGWNGTPDEGLKLPIPDIARGIIERERQWGLEGRVNPGPADLPVNELGESLESEFRKYGVRWRKTDKRPGSRVTGVELMRKRILATQERPMEHPGIWVFDSCRQFLRIVPSLPRSASNPDDVDTAAEDHAWDSAMYRLLARKHSAAELRVRGI